MRWHPELILVGPQHTVCCPVNERYLRHARGLIPLRGYATRSAARKGAERAMAAADMWFMETIGGVPPVVRAILAAVGSTTRPSLRFSRSCALSGSS